MGLTDTIIFLIIGVIILTVFAPAIISAAGDLLEAIALSLGIIKKTPLELALECAYYRCELGCYSTKVVEEIKWTEGGKEVSCQKFCQNILDPILNKNDGKICGRDSKRHPVIVHLDEDVELSEADVKKLGSCIVVEKEPEKRIWSGVVSVDEDLVKSYGEYEERNVGGTAHRPTIVKCYKSLELKKGTLIIYNIIYKPGLLEMRWYRIGEFKEGEGTGYVS